MKGAAVPQPMRPSGLVGRLFGLTMDIANAGAYRAALVQARPAPGGRLIEIGFGTGALVKRVLGESQVALVAGVDPSPLMVSVAQQRNQEAVTIGRADLREGTASELPWPDAYFDTALALHCFQFWANPVADLTEIRRVLRPAGRLILLLRAHGNSPPAWLPNPISRSGDEIAGAIALFRQSGFTEVTLRGKAGSSAIVTGDRDR